jgi:hypothetical protein
MKIISRSLVTTLVLLCFRLLQTVEAVVPPPDGGYPNFTAAEGQNCLFGLTAEQIRAIGREPSVNAQDRFVECCEVNCRLIKVSRSRDALANTRGRVCSPDAALIYYRGFDS